MITASTYPDIRVPLRTNESLRYYNHHFENIFRVSAELFGWVAFHWLAKGYLTDKIIITQESLLPSVGLMALTTLGLTASTVGAMIRSTQIKRNYGQLTGKEWFLKRTTHEPEIEKDFLPPILVTALYLPAGCIAALTVYFLSVLETSWQYCQAGETDLEKYKMVWFGQTRELNLGCTMAVEMAPIALIILLIHVNCLFRKKEIPQPRPFFISEG